MTWFLTALLGWAKINWAPIAGVCFGVGMVAFGPMFWHHLIAEPYRHQGYVKGQEDKQKEWDADKKAIDAQIEKLRGEMAEVNAKLLAKAKSQNTKAAANLAADLKVIDDAESREDVIAAGLAGVERVRNDAARNHSEAVGDPAGSIPEGVLRAA